MAIPLRHNDFGHFRVERGGRQAWALRATCKDCSKSEDAILGGTKATLSQDFAQKLFRNKGWQVGGDRHSDRCPSCIAAELKARKEAQQKALDALPSSPVLNDPIPAIPADDIPRERLGKPMHWKPTPGELKEILADRDPVEALDAKKRRDSLNWYPAITKGAETLVKMLIETRISKRNGMFRYDGHWNDMNVTALVNELVPGLDMAQMAVRMIRVQFFGQSKDMPKRIATPPAPAPLPTVTFDPAPKAAPEPVREPPKAVAPSSGVLPFPKPLPPASGPEKPIMTDVETRLDRMEQDLLDMFGDIEKLKENRGFNAVLNKIEPLEQRIARLEKGGTPSKGIEDYSITELLAEIAKRTSSAERAG